MRKVEQFYNCTDHTSTQWYKKAVAVVGLQPGSDIWVLNKNTHIMMNGVPLSQELSPYCWVAASGLPPLDMQCLVPAAVEGLGVTHATLALSNLIWALKDVHQHNFPAALLLLGSQIMSMFYEQILAIADQVPATLAFGKVCLGKSKAAEAAQSIMGLCKGFRPSKITDKQATRLSVLSTLGFVIDDPTAPKEFCEKVLLHFDKGLSSSCASDYEPKCTFTVTLNIKCFEAFAALPKRYVCSPLLPTMPMSDHIHAKIYNETPL
jgi:hypothetical protein